MVSWPIPPLEAAYPGTLMQRTVAMVQLSAEQKPFVVDLFRLTSDAPRQFDLPFWYVGQHLGVNAETEATTSDEPLGQHFGYQHLRQAAQAQPKTGSTQFQWLADGTFYTLTSEVLPRDEWRFVRLGANDPEFNLRRDAA